MPFDFSVANFMREKITATLVNRRKIDWKAKKKLV
jgi:hypothetical protein